MYFSVLSLCKPTKTTYRRKRGTAELPLKKQKAEWRVQMFLSCAVCSVSLTLQSISVSSHLTHLQEKVDTPSIRFSFLLFVWLWCLIYLVCSAVLERSSASIHFHVAIHSYCIFKVYLLNSIPFRQSFKCIIKSFHPETMQHLPEYPQSPWCQQLPECQAPPVEWRFKKKAGHL